MELYIQKMRIIYKRRKDTMAGAIRKYFPEGITWMEPKGGFYIWLKLPPKLDIMAVLKSSIEKGAVFVIGKTFLLGELDQCRKEWITAISGWRIRIRRKTKLKRVFVFLVIH